jgi:cytochrome b
MSRPLSRPGETLIRERVWDLPTRLFHWSLVALVGLSWWTAETHRDDLHLWFGYAVVFLLLFRIGWGFFGSSTARFVNFVRGPAAVLRYCRSRFRWTAAGHTPLGALSVVALLAVLLFQVGTGLVAMDEDGLFGGPLTHLVSISTSDAALELHEEAFDILKLLVVLHVAAILLYRLLGGLNLLGPMISGRADLAPGVEPMRPVPPLVFVACVLLALAITAWIIAGAPPFGT